MNNELILNIAFNVIGGLGIFLLGMRNMSDGLQTIAGDRLRKLIGMVTNNRLMASGVGAFVTCIIQSSSITTVMVVGFVNAGIMTLHQAIGVIMGANIGTTITGWIMVINIGKYGMPIMGLAAMVHLFAKREKLRYAAMAIMGIGMVFVGLELMKNGFAPIKDIPTFEEWFHKFQADSYFGVLKCALVGCILTLIVQSSSATLGITMGLASTGIIGFETAAALVLGENVGTTITAFLASFGTTTNGKRTAYAHVVFNMLGVLWITAIFGHYIEIIQSVVGHQLIGLPDGEPSLHVMAGIAAVHTGFNIANTLLFLPLAGLLAKLLIKIVPDKPVKLPPKHTKLSSLMLNSPMVGIAQSRKEVVHMGRIDREMFDMVRTVISNPVVDEDLVKEIFAKEDRLDGMQMEITAFLTNLLSGDVPRSLGQEAQKLIRLTDEYETISDYLTAQLKLYLRISNAQVVFPDIMREELLTMHDLVSDYFNTVNRAYKERNVAMLKKSNEQTEAISQKIREFRGSHIARLEETPVDPLLSTTYPDMLVSYRRTKEHILNIAEVMVGKGGYAGRLPEA